MISKAFALICLIVLTFAPCSTAEEGTSKPAQDSEAQTPPSTSSTKDHTEVKSIASSPPTDVVATNPVETELPTEKEEIEKTYSYTLLDLLPLIGAFIGVLGILIGIGISWCLQQWQLRKEYRSLILAFAVEFVLAFERCIIYYRQNKTYEKNGKIEVSKSVLFDFTDPSILSKFATVSRNLEVIVGIVDLKSIYFQVRPHVERAAQFAIEAERPGIQPRQNRDLMLKARQAQGTALAFFLSSYETTEDATGKILQAAKDISPGRDVDNLIRRFEEKKNEKYALDKTP